MKLLNLGCGTSHHADWTNIDFVSTHPNVKAHNLLHGIPFADQSYDVVYHSHVLEHFPKEAARTFLSQCNRVLKTGGILRAVVPDLESIVKCYLEKLEQCCEDNSCVADDYDWIMLELYDQVVRNQSGGEMESFLVNLNEKDRLFVRERIGDEAEAIWRSPNIVPRARRLIFLMNRIGSRASIKLLREKLASWLVYLIAGNAAFKSFREGIFRNRGEVHQWMYDRYSLKRLLENAGFKDVKVCTAHESRIFKFEKYSLDVANGNVRKPDSLYIEATKP
ncbi:MAG: putative SAM-dependent methyltransferase [Polaribacter sp.]|jgi:predicted SAM-dependent methyltransferase